MRIQTGNPGACGERSKRSKWVTAPAKIASSISPGETRDRQEARRDDGAEDEKGQPRRRVLTAVDRPGESAERHGRSHLTDSAPPRRDVGYNEGDAAPAPSRDDDSADHPSRRAPHLARLHRPRRPSGPLPPSPGRLQGVPRRRFRPRPDDGEDAEGLRHRDRRAPAGGPAALPELAASSAGASGSPTSSSKGGRSSRSPPSAARPEPPEGEPGPRATWTS